MRSKRFMRSVKLVAASFAAPLAIALPVAAHAEGMGGMPLPEPTPAATPAPTATPTPTATSTPAPTEQIVITAQRPVKPLSGDIEPKWGNIRTFWGDSSPLWGNIRTFWGDVNPYEGDLNAFWGNIRTFNDGTTSNTISPLWGNIRTFTGELGASWGNIRTFWGNIRTFEETPGDYATLATMLTNMVTTSQSFWGPSVQAQTGKSFAEAFANPLFAKYGIDLSDPRSLEKLDANAREHFFLEWYDGLMNFSGADHVDHWMSSIKWAPSITTTIGEGKRSVIGLLDFSVTGGESKNIVKYDGISDFTTGHGSAVASLMVAAHDGKGVMGIAPMASVVAYNPFDSTGTAGWADIRNGVLMLAQNNASIINMSLGVPGWTLHQGWNDVFSDPAVAAATKNTVFVLAAGNSGVVQTQNIDWNFATNPNIIVVGSVDPAGQISSFSNQPGTACLLSAGKCIPGNELMYRFITAPGELILVSDGNGGVTRMSGTSFAAPLVSGTIALIHDRWPWLSNYPKETVDIIFKSAKDVGAPGVDPIYGWGILDVTAALSPLNFNTLKWYQYRDGKIVPEQMSKIRNPKEVAKWEAQGMFFYAYEDVGASFRDFAIPVSSKLAGQTALGAGGTQEYLQSYIYSRFLAWVNAGGTTSGTSGKGFASFAALTSPVYNSAGLNMTMAIAPRTRMVGYRQGNLPYQTMMRVAGPDEKLSFAFGEGDGAVMLGGAQGFTMASDYDPVVGGANPLLGYASGGAFMETEVKLGDHWSASAGLTQRTLKRDLKQLAFLDQVAYGAIDAYQAGAQHMTLTYAAGGTRLSGTYTRLREDNALFGVQSIDPNDFADGTTTDGFSLSGEKKLGSGLMLTATGTVSRTRPGGDGRSNLSVAGGGLISSSFQVAATKDNLFGRNDQLRLTVSQPMHLERGSIDLTTVQVVNRQTGELGPITQRFQLGIPERQLVGELMYGRSMLDGAGQFMVFGRANLQGEESDQLPAVMAGAGFRLAF